MTDFELLTFSALAVNKGVWHHLTHGEKWNPLRNHAQAKQVRHLLQLTTGFDGRWKDLGPCAYATYPTGEFSCNSIMQNIEEAGGKKAALRRAIVRAAAELWRLDHSDESYESRTTKPEQADTGEKP